MLFNPTGHFVHTAAATLQDVFHRSMLRLLGDRTHDLPEDQPLDLYLTGCSLRPEKSDESNSAGVGPPGLIRNMSESLTEPPVSPDRERTISFAASTCFTTALDSGRSLARSTSFDSGCAEDEEDASEWGRLGMPYFPAASFSSSEMTAIRETTDRCELGARGVASLLSDLCKSVLRLKDDLFVVSLAKKGASSLKRARSLSWEEESVVIPSARPTGKKSRLPLHLANKSSTKKAAANFYAVRASDADEVFGEGSTRLLEALAPDTSDPDPLNSSSFINTRHTFLEMCQFRHYQFDSLRRAKHSSLMLLYHLHKAADPAVVASIRPRCQRCDQNIVELRWHCDQCVDMDLCAPCVVGGATHEHPLTPFRVTFR
jgi:hypothetical protein